MKRNSRFFIGLTASCLAVTLMMTPAFSVNASDIAPGNTPSATQTADELPNDPPATPEIPANEYNWLKTDAGWTYQNKDGYCLKNIILKLDNKYYYLNDQGVLATGLTKIKVSTLVNNKLSSTDIASDAIPDSEIIKIDTLLKAIPSGATTFSMYFTVSSSTVTSPETGLGKSITGFKSIDGSKYYFNDNGIMLTGLQTISGYKYYFDSNGKMKTGWQTIDNRKYYFETSGKAKTGWQTISGTKYYFNSAGKLGVGWGTIDGKKYYFKDGIYVKGWQTIKGLKYYFSSSGVMYTGKHTISNKTYYFGTDGTFRTGWQTIDGKKFYYNSDGSMVTGWKRFNGKRYFFRRTKTSKCPKGEMLTGWHYINGLKYYFTSSGTLVQDVSSKIGKQSSYKITVNRKKCIVTIYAKDGSKGYTIPVKSMTCSVGKASTPTVKGTYKTLTKYRWKELMGPSWGQYATQIVRGYFFHSVAGYRRNIYNLSARDYNMLGSPASHGCVRLCVRDAKWIYDNCKLGTSVTISDTEKTPFDKPATIKIKASQNWDPTDPAIKKK